MSSNLDLGIFRYGIFAISQHKIWFSGRKKVYGACLMVFEVH